MPRTRCRGAHRRCPASTPLCGVHRRGRRTPCSSTPLNGAHPVEWTTSPGRCRASTRCAPVVFLLDLGSGQGESRRALPARCTASTHSMRTTLAPPATPVRTAEPGLHGLNRAPLSDAGPPARSGCFSLTDLATGRRQVADKGWVFTMAATRPQEGHAAATEPSGWSPSRGRPPAVTRPVEDATTQGRDRR